MTAPRSPQPDPTPHVHDQRYDGDDPYLVCHGCGQRWDALTGLPLNVWAGPQDSLPTSPNPSEAAVTEPSRGTICVCGLAKSYHPNLADHGGRAMGPHVRPDTFEPCIAGADAVFLPKSIIAALEAHAPIPRRHRDGSPSDEPGDTICRWCRVYAGIDHDEDCAIAVARLRGGRCLRTGLRQDRDAAGQKRLDDQLQQNYPDVTPDDDPYRRSADAAAREFAAWPEHKKNPPTAPIHRNAADPGGSR